MDYIKQLQALKTDVEKWKWLMSNNNIGHKLYVVIDNDETFIVDSTNQSETCNFDYAVGNSPGIYYLLNALKIPFQEV